MAHAFAPDEQLAHSAGILAEGAVVFAEENFGVVLDFSDESVINVERMLGELHRTMPADPPPAQLSMFAEMFGSYLGEVYRRSRGGTWGYYGEGTERFPGLHADEVDFWPWSRTHKRLVDGDADDVWAYFRAIVRPDDPTAATPAPPG